MNIEKSRYGEKLDIIMDIDEDINCKLPSLIIQPVVENSIKHGVRNRIEGGTIKISVKDQVSHVVIQISDDGPGIDAKQLKVIKEGSPGAKDSVGLRNIYRRMHMLYGYGPQIESVKGKGTTVTIRIKKQQEEVG